MLGIFLSQLSLRTSLEELLDWDSDLADFLVGSWSRFPITKENDKELTVALFAAQLPREKYDIYAAQLEQWVTNNYNIFVR